MKGYRFTHTRYYAAAREPITHTLARMPKPPKGRRSLGHHRQRHAHVPDIASARAPAHAQVQGVIGVSTRATACWANTPAVALPGLLSLPFFVFFVNEKKSLKKVPARHCLDRDSCV